MQIAFGSGGIASQPKVPMPAEAGPQAYETSSGPLMVFARDPHCLPNTVHIYGGFCTELGSA